MQKAIITLCFCIAATIGYSQSEIPEDVNKLLTKNLCSACHKLDQKLVGPSYKELASKGNSEKEIIALIYEPNPSNWPDYPPMAPLPHLDKNEVKTIAKWIKSLEKK